MGSPIASGLVLFAVLLSGAAYAAGPDTASGSAVFSLAPLRYSIEPRQDLGKKRAGMICLPNGSVNFRDLRLPPAEMIGRDVSEMLKSAGLDVSSPDLSGFADQSVPYGIIATIVGIDLSVCAKRWGLGDASTVKGTAAVTIDWSVYERARRERVAFATSRGTYATGSESIDIGDLVAKAIVDGAAKLAQSPQGTEISRLR